MPRRIETLFIRGPAGLLQAMLESGDGEPREAVLLCHPHPLYGGTMRNKVVHRIARGLGRTGAAVLRFNFRGVGLSEGAFDDGRGELDDARASMEWLRARFPETPYSIAGFSFGSRIALRLACELGTVARVIGVGVPTGAPAISGLARCRRPKIIIQSTHDQFGPREELERLFETFSEPKRLIWIEARDHFFDGALEHLEHTIQQLD
ncbi:MAG: alpha/beta hydrolase [bacterium]|jgi:alpha/beta superfamily hydrolase